MKKQYITPSTQIIKVQLQNMLCESLAISDTKVEAGNALGRRGGNVWDDDEDF